MSKTRIKTVKDMEPLNEFEKKVLSMWIFYRGGYASSFNELFLMLSENDNNSISECDVEWVLLQLVKKGYIRRFEDSMLLYNEDKDTISQAEEESYLLLDNLREIIPGIPWYTKWLEKNLRRCKKESVPETI